ncbi:DUF1983 domain-containing protein [Maritalea myrionectae]|uniref:DUF1983 domain-containing protein n=1 Tax=Maritalea myrionectae TaxID=454601 RepID=UPI0003F83F45|nr:DUF1983 domain-containing protein [Maritalea myrionectae]
MFRTLLFSFALVLALTEVASAAALTAALFGQAFAGTFAGALVSFGFTTAASFALQYVQARWFSPKQQEQQYDPRQISYGERVPRQGFFGRQLLGGHFVHYNEFDDAKKCQCVYVLADHWIDGLEGIVINGRQHELLPVAGPYTNNEAERFQVDGFGALIDIRLHDGRPGQLADTDLVTYSPGWDANKRYAGMAYLAITLTSDKEKFGGQRPRMEFIARGARLYDRRKDSSVGGSGTHRFDDPTTWEYSVNPIVAAEHFSRGFFHNGRRVLGAGLSAADLDLDTNIVGINVCDEQVLQPDGTYRNRAEAHLTWTDNQRFADVLDRLCATAGGGRAEKQGYIAFFAGKAKSIVKTITDDDLVADAPVRFAPKQAGIMKFTGLHGTYTRPDDLREAPYKAIEPAQYVAEDGGSRLDRLDWPEVQNAHQAHLLTQQAVLSSRFSASGKITLDIKDIILEIGDWIIWASANPLRGTRTYEIVATTFDWYAGRVQLSLEETDASIFDDNATLDDVVEPPREQPLFGYQKQVYGFGVDAVALEGADGSRVPALKLTYNAITDPAIRAVKFEYRVVGDTEILKAVDNSVGDGVYYSSDGVMPGYTYEARARLDAMPGRETIWTNWMPIDVPTGPMVVVLQPGQVDYSHLATDLGNEVGILNGTGAGSLSAIIDHLKDEIERVAVVSIGENVNSHVQREKLSAGIANALAEILNEATVRASEDDALASLLTVLSAEVDDNAAAIVNESTARATEDDALAQQIIDTAAAMGTAYAQGLFKVDATVDGGGASATMTLKVRAGTGDSFVDSGIRLIANSNGTSQVVLVADETVVLDNVGASLALFQSDGTFVGARIPQITSDMIEVTDLSAISANIGEVTSGLIRSDDDKMRVELDDSRIIISD